jgi:hypothetical protein
LAVATRPGIGGVERYGCGTWPGKAAPSVESIGYEGEFGHPPNDGRDFCRRMLTPPCELNGGDAKLGREPSRYLLEAG